MFYVYLLKSEIDKDIYVGYSENLRKRFKEHNQAKVKSTKCYCPWILIYYEAYRNKKDAIKRERQLKNHKPKDDLIKQIENSIIS